MIPRVSRSTFRALAARSTASTFPRNIHSSGPKAKETVKDKVRDLGHKVNIKVGQGLASAIDTGEKMTHATQDKIKSTGENVEEGKDFVEKKANKAVQDAQKTKEGFKEELKK